MACIAALHDDPNVDVLLLAEEYPRRAGIERKIRISPRSINGRASAGQSPLRCSRH